MEEPGTMTLVFRLILIFLVAVALPQVIGVPVLRWAFRKRKRIVLVPALLVAPAIFFTSAYIFWGMRAESIRAEGQYVCGAFGAAAFLSTAWGTAIHLGISGAALLCMRLSAKRLDSRVDPLSR